MTCLYALQTYTASETADNVKKAARPRENYFQSRKELYDSFRQLQTRERDD